jgi:hypothetical protein
VLVSRMTLPTKALNSSISTKGGLHRSRNQHPVWRYRPSTKWLRNLTLSCKAT